MGKIMQSFLKNILAIATQAGDLIRADFAEPITPIHKADGSVVTKTDRAAENLIRIGLSQLAPYIPFVGEESVEAGIIPDISAGEFWCVDPLDGTSNFVKGQGDKVGVLIALVRDFTPVLGVVHIPMHRQTYAGSLTEGAWQIDASGKAEKLPSLNAPDLTAPRVMIEDRYAEKSAIQKYIQSIPGQKTTIVRSTWPYVQLALGQADLCPGFSKAYEWDTAACQGVLAAVGGAVVVGDKSPLRYGKIGDKFKNPDTLAAHPDLLPQLSGF